MSASDIELEYIEHIKYVHDTLHVSDEKFQSNSSRSLTTKRHSLKSTICVAQLVTLYYQSLYYPIVIDVIICRLLMSNTNITVITAVRCYLIVPFGCSLTIPQYNIAIYHC